MSGWARFSRGMKLLSLALVPLQGRVRFLYRHLQRRDLLTARTSYVNLGYWKDDPPGLDEACEALVDLVADTAGMTERDEVLDVGCGFGDQDIRWMEWGRAARVSGLNISEEQVTQATARVAHAGLSDRITMTCGDARDMPFEDASFDVVCAVESAFHIAPRRAFVSEAFRVLRPGGRLVLADPCGVPRALSLPERVGLLFGRSFWQVPAQNLYPARAYDTMLRDSGFVNVTIDSIQEHVHPRFREFAARRLYDPELTERASWAYVWLLRNSIKAQLKKPRPPVMDYVIAKAVKPR